MNVGGSPDLRFAAGRGQAIRHSASLRPCGQPPFGRLGYYPCRNLPILLLPAGPLALWDEPPAPVTADTGPDAHPRTRPASLWSASITSAPPDASPRVASRATCLKRQAARPSPNPPPRPSPSALLRAPASPHHPRRTAPAPAAASPANLPTTNPRQATRRPHPNQPSRCRPPLLRPALLAPRGAPSIRRCVPPLLIPSAC